MGGLYITCATFHGEDKSGSAMSQVVADLQAGLGGTPGEWFEGMLVEVDEDTGVAFHIEVNNHEMALSNLEKLTHEYRTKFPGVQDWYEIFEMEIKTGMDSTKGKYGESIGWRLYCVQDLIQAFKVSKESGEPIIVTYD